MPEQLIKWNEPAPTFEINKSSLKPFELFFTNEVMERICTESINYFRLKARHGFTITIWKSKFFTPWLSEYTEYNIEYNFFSNLSIGSKKGFAWLYRFFNDGIIWVRELQKLCSCKSQQ